MKVSILHRGKEQSFKPNLWIWMKQISTDCSNLTIWQSSRSSWKEEDTILKWNSKIQNWFGKMLICMSAPMGYQRLQLSIRKILLNIKIIGNHSWREFNLFSIITDSIRKWTNQSSITFISVICGWSGMINSLVVIQFLKLWMFPDLMESNCYEREVILMVHVWRCLHSRRRLSMISDGKFNLKFSLEKIKFWMQFLHPHLRWNHHTVKMSLNKLIMIILWMVKPSE